MGNWIGEESQELLLKDLAILNNMKQEIAVSVSDRLASHTQIGFCYVALFKNTRAGK